MINAGGGSLSYDDQLGFNQLVREQYSGDTQQRLISQRHPIVCGGRCKLPLISALFLQAV